MQRGEPLGRKTSYEKGLGKTLDQDKAMDAYSVRLPAFYARMARQAGCGSLSEGIRVALEQWVARQKNSPPA